MYFRRCLELMEARDACQLWQEIYCHSSSGPPAGLSLQFTDSSESQSQPTQEDMEYGNSSGNGKVPFQYTPTCVPVNTGRGYRCNNCNYSVGAHCYNVLAREESGSQREKRKRTALPVSCQGRRHKASELTEIGKDYFKVSFLSSDCVECAICESALSWSDTASL